MAALSDMQIWKPLIIVLVLYALIFGFAYPRLRGRTPVAKALALAVFLLPVELLSMLSAVPEYENPADPEADEILMPATSDIVAAVAIRTGQVVAFGQDRHVGAGTLQA